MGTRYYTDDEIRERFENRENLPQEIQNKLNEIEDAFMEFAVRIDKIVSDVNPRASALMFTNLQQAQMWAEKATKTRTSN